MINVNNLHVISPADSATAYRTRPETRMTNNMIYIHICDCQANFTGII